MVKFDLFNTADNEEETSDFGSSFGSGFGSIFGRQESDEIIKPRGERINPAIAKPLGILNKPTKEKINPNGPKKTPIGKMIKPISPKANPAVPIPFEGLAIC